jgi:o-succinylbenzoate synthase
VSSNPATGSHACGSKISDTCALVTSARIGVVSPLVPSAPPLPSLAELQSAAYVVRLPMRVRFRGLTGRELLLLRGPVGWGEFGPFGEYDDEESARWLAAAVEAGWGSWPAAIRSSVPVNATVPAVAAGQVAEVLAQFPGSTTAKVKVAESGQSLADDIERVAAVVDALGGSDGRVRVDSNGGWSVADALEALPRLASAASPAVFEYAEQPCASLPELVELRGALARAGHDIQIAADESVRKAEDPLRVAVAGAADVIVVKVAPLGGVAAALAVARSLGTEHDLPVVVSSALDSAVGISAGLALAAALPDLPFACGLATGGFFTSDVCADPLLAVAGSIAVRRVSADPGLLQSLAVDPDREAWWRDRLARCHAVLDRTGRETRDD